MFPSLERQRQIQIPPDLTFAWHRGHMLDALIESARELSSKEHKLIQGISYLPESVLEPYGLPLWPNAFYLSGMLEVPEGLWINVRLRFPGVAEQWKAKGMATVSTYPVIQDAWTWQNTGEKVYQVLHMPDQCFLSGERLLPFEKHKAQKPWIESYGELLLEGWRAAVVTAEVFIKLGVNERMLYRYNVDITEPEVRASTAYQRGEQVQVFERKLAGKEFYVNHDGKMRYFKTSDGRNFVQS
ncbi:MAG: hypothetical protein UY16_C0025G0008 [Candidatus Gottesmanbacteria bacterium GW2011_GWA2_47_9]|uniref:Uncharacterized protein n=1 Tax=Candidatus Gottesmanbacteria bacterium GW2011_GWA2_47_9 TaxID=1618445 RepID=A0A0G1WZ79_9BACT|nr:MAG: hypothetical protein UY16_C0025G0008 [Candidatus Gottesmanbacteria bacterium GW2011_GWA2_47_9]